MKVKTIIFALISMFCFMSIGSGLTLAADENSTDSWKLSNYGVYTTIGDVSYDGNKIIMSTNGYNVWGLADECTFISKPYPFLHDECSSLTTTVTINSIEDAKVFGAGAGLMIRDSDTPGSANVHWRVLPSGDTRFTYRTVKDGASGNKSGPKLNFPVELKLVRQGDIFTAYYKQDGVWKVHTYVKVEMGTNVVAGLAAFSADSINNPNALPIKVTYSDFTAESTDSYVAPSGTYVDTEPLNPTTLLRERFEDGSATNLPAAINNPVWEGVKFANIIKDSLGNYVWKRDRMMGIVAAGSKNWTDYEASMDFRFDPSMAGQKNIGQLLVRARTNQFYGDYYYAAGFTDNTKFVLQKVTRSGTPVDLGSVTIPNYVDGVNRNVKVKVFDNTIEVFLDNVSKIKYTDDKLPILKGRIGIRTELAIVSLDNIIVTKLDDPLGGDYDNSVGGNFNKTAPAGVQ